MAGELILIVEDNEKNRKLIQDIFPVKMYLAEGRVSNWQIGDADQFGLECDRKGGQS